MSRNVRTRIALVVLAALGIAPVLGAASASAATDVGECIAAIAVVRGDLGKVTIGGRNAAATRDGLERKLDDAEAKLEQTKYSDALTKLWQFRDKVEDLQAQGKLSGASGDIETLLAHTEDVITCVEGLLGSTG